MIDFHTCRFCKQWQQDEHGLKPSVRYSTRHYAHPDCLLKAKGAAAWALLKDWPLANFPALAAHRAGLLDSLHDALVERDVRGAKHG